MIQVGIDYKVLSSRRSVTNEQSIPLRHEKVSRNHFIQLEMAIKINII